MRIYNYFAALLLSASLLVSCSKSSGIDEPVVPQEPETPTAKLPNITFGKPGTKAMLNDADLKTAGSKIRVYDILTGYTGVTFEGWDPTTPYINEEIVYDGNVVWKYASNGVYPWTATGTHKFFGYLTFDKKSELTNPFSPSLSGTTMTVPAFTFKNTSTQFDFLYSDMVERDASAKDYSVVPLNFKHLFTALSVDVESKTDVPVMLESVDFVGLKNKNSATIAFASPSSSVTLGTSSTDGSFFPTMSSTQTLNENDIYDPLTQTYYDDPTQYSNTFFLIWPQTADDVAPTTAGNPSSDSLIVVKYKMYIDGAWETNTRTARMKLPKMAWEAGKKVHFTIQFSDKMIQLTTKVLPWDYNEYDVDYAEGTLVVPTGLKFDPSTCSVSGNVATVLSGKNPVGTFTIMAPVGGEWFVGLTGDTEYFTISPSSGTIDPNDAASGRVTLTVTPNLGLARPTDKKVKLRFTVIANGREIDAQSEINRDDWIILLPKN
ncbi:MAG: fimbrillin family protein [Bacteroidales bacterium]|nr:fimbrillin family protein [Bacteroidales bacterium]